MTHDEEYMQRCLELAEQGRTAVAPNPMVGCVIVRDGQIVSEGFHVAFGEPHAESAAISSVENASELCGSSLYVNLEPCSHHGKTPPCADLIIRSGISEVVIGTPDPNPAVCGKGIEKLRQAGIAVSCGTLEEECRELNKRFFTLHQKNRPYVILKWAQTTDHFIARADGSSKWISSEASRKLVHCWRSEEQAILVGTNTAELDNPELTVRHVQGTDPLRVVIDKELRLDSKTLKLFDGSVPTLVFNSHKSTSEKNLEFVKLELPLEKNILTNLAQRRITSLIVEGGAATLNFFITAGLWDEARVFTSPEKFGAGIPAPWIDAEAALTETVGNDVLQVFFKPHSA